MEKYVFFDFNGTILDDVDLCLTLLNKMLNHHGYSSVSKEKYLEIFTFPVIEYYKKAGFELDKLSFDELAIEFINEYQPRSMKECKIYDGFVDLAKELRENGYKVVCLSASKRDLLIEQLKNFNIEIYFDYILGLDNINATSKIDVAKKFILDNNISSSNIYCVGDSLHDLEVGDILGATTILVASGHQAKHRLLEKTPNVVDNIQLIKNYLK